MKKKLVRISKWASVSSYNNSSHLLWLHAFEYFEWSGRNIIKKKYIKHSFKTYIQSFFKATAAPTESEPNQLLVNDQGLNIFVPFNNRKNIVCFVHTKKKEKKKQNWKKILYSKAIHAMREYFTIFFLCKSFSHGYSQKQKFHPKFHI